MTLSRLVRSLFFGRPSDRSPGLLLFRILLGLGMLTHGLPKLQGGPDTWAALGGVMGRIGVPGPAIFWGFMAAFAEGVCGALLLLGAFTRPAAFMMVSTMAVAAFVVHAADPLARRELALLYLSGALLFLFKGGGRFSLDSLFSRSSSR